MQIETKSFYADLFSKTSHGEPVPPSLPVPVRNSLPVPVEQGPQPEPTELKNLSSLAEIIGDIDARNLSPRQMANLSLDLYAAGAVSFEDYAELAFQPELHPDFDQTIGALTGEKANPDRPRDFVRLWEDRAAFQRRHNYERTDLIEQSERIASVLRQIEKPTNKLI